MALLAKISHSPWRTAAAAAADAAYLPQYVDGKLASYLDREGRLTIAPLLTNRKCPCGDRHWSRLLEAYQGYWLRFVSRQFYTFILRLATKGGSSGGSRTPSSQCTRKPARCCARGDVEERAVKSLPRRDVDTMRHQTLPRVRQGAHCEPRDGARGRPSSLFYLTQYARS
jgi:hypothetical protein